MESHGQLHLSMSEPRQCRYASESGSNIVEEVWRLSCLPDRNHRDVMADREALDSPLRKG